MVNVISTLTRVRVLWRERSRLARRETKAYFAARRGEGRYEAAQIHSVKQSKSGEMNSPLQEDQDAGLPDKNRQDPHKPGESPALQNRRADGALQLRKRRQAAALQNRPLHSLENVEPARHLAISRVSSDLGLRYSSD